MSRLLGVTLHNNMHLKSHTYRDLLCFTMCLLLLHRGQLPRILRGAPAASPEEMVRARFSACRSKDAVFMAKTEAMREGKRANNRSNTCGEMILYFPTSKGDNN